MGQSGKGEAAGGATPPVVMQVVPALGQGGAERGAVDIAVALAEAGARTFVVSSGGPLERELRRAGARLVRLPVDRKNPLVMRDNAERLAALVREHGVDILHARSRAPAWSARAAARRAGCRFVTTFHATYNAGNPLKYRYNAVMTSAQRVIAISKFIADHIRTVYRLPATRIEVIHRGVDVAVFDPARVAAARIVQLAEEWQLPDGAPVVMLPGRLTRWKGQTVFLEALARLEPGSFCAVLVGSDQGRTGYRYELERRAGALGLAGSVRFVDHCRDMPAAFMLADVVVSASTDPEGFGRVIAEAQAMGRPVVATDHGGAREIVAAGETGWLVPPGEPEALAAAIREALALTPEARARLAETATARVRASFTKDLMCAKTLALYDHVRHLRPFGAPVEPAARP